MIEMMIIAAIVSSITLRVAGNVAVDGFFAARGQESPRYTRAKARRKPGAASRYWSEVWDDAWSDASKRRSEKRSDPSRPRGAARVFWSNLWRDGWVDLERKRQEKVTRPRPETVTVPGTVVPDFPDGLQDDGQDEDEEPYLYGPDPFVVPGEDGRTNLRFGDDPTDPTGVSSCPECRGTAITEDGICLSCRDRQEQRNQHYEDQTTPDFGPDPTAPPTTQEGPTTMTTTMPTDTEVVSLSKAIDYSESTARVAAEMVNSIDFTESSLAAGGVTGVAVEAFASAKENFGSIAAAMTRAASEFKAQLAIQEAYNANPGAGSKEFIMGGR